MLNKSIIVFLFSFIVFNSAFAIENNDSLFIRFNFRFGKAPLQLNNTFISGNNDTIQIHQLKFYISDIKIHYTDQSTFIQNDSYHLVDIENQESKNIAVCKFTQKQIKKITFNIGIDSLVSSSGIHNGTLDPINGMYWTWQSGYINFKIEGKSPSCNTRQNKFKFHIGGYLHPNYALRTITLFPKKESSNIDIAINLARFFDKIHLDTNNTMMIPSSKAMELADLSTQLFQLE